MYFASDNSGPVPQAVLDAIAEANTGYAMPYGNDPWTARAEAMIRDLFDAPEAAVFLVATGTTANALALSVLAQPWQAVFAHHDAHIANDECNAPEFYTGGAKLVGLAGDHARIDPDGLNDTLTHYASQKGPDTQSGPLSITNVTECGTVYDPDEIGHLTGIAKRFGLPTHLDGARFANAVAALGCSPAELTWKAGIDALSFGGTKNGLMGVEAVVLFSPDKAREFAFRRKRAGHLFSKSRFLAAQMIAYLSDDLWLSLARKANSAAAKLETALARVPNASLVHPRQANMLFAEWPARAHKRASAGGAAYYLRAPEAALDGPGGALLGARLVCNWATSDADIDGFVDLLTGAAQG